MKIQRIRIMTINEFIDAYHRMILSPIGNNHFQGFLLSNNMRFLWNDSRLTEQSRLTLTLKRKKAAEKKK